MLNTADITTRTARRALAALALVLLAACQEEGLTLPSGLEAERLEVLNETQPDGETWLILRVLAPDLAGQQVDAETRAADMDRLCAEWGIPAAEDTNPAPAQITVQMMSEAVERGRPAPGIAQVFAGYRFENGACIWEDF